MKNVLNVLATMLSAAAMAVQEPAPSRQWVRDYVRTNAMPSATYTRSVKDGVVTVTGTLGGESVTITGQIHDRLALVATNALEAAVAAGITNGMRFAWDGSGSFTNAPAAKSIRVSTSCFLFEGVESVRDGICDMFPGLFGVLGTKVTRAESAFLGGLK